MTILNTNAIIKNYDRDNLLYEERVFVENYTDDPYNCNIYFPSGSDRQLGSNESLILDDEWEKITKQCPDHVVRIAHVLYFDLSNILDPHMLCEKDDLCEALIRAVIVSA